MLHTLTSGHFLKLALWLNCDLSLLSCNNSLYHLNLWHFFCYYRIIIFYGLGHRYFLCLSRRWIKDWWNISFGHLLDVFLSVNLHHNINIFLAWCLLPLLLFILTKSVVFLIEYGRSKIYSGCAGGYVAVIAHVRGPTISIQPHRHQ